MSTDLTVAPEVKKGIKQLTNYAEKLDIKSVEDASDAGIKLFQIADLKKKVEDERTSITKPMNLALRSTNAFFKKFSEPLDIIDAQIREKVKLFGTESGERVFGVVHLKRLMGMKVTDINKVPRKYLMVDTAKVKADLKEGVEIPGIELVEDTTVSL